MQRVTTYLGDRPGVRAALLLAAVALIGLTLLPLHVRHMILAQWILFVVPLVVGATAGWLGFSIRYFLIGAGVTLTAMLLLWALWAMVTPHPWYLWSDDVPYLFRGG